MTPREIEGFCTDCGSWTPLHGGRCGCGSGRVAVPPAGYVILPAAEVEARERAARDRALDAVAEFLDVMADREDALAIAGAPEMAPIYRRGEFVAAGGASHARALKGAKP